MSKKKATKSKSKNETAEIFTLTLTFLSEKDRTNFIKKNAKILSLEEEKGGPFRIATDDVYYKSDEFMDDFDDECSDCDDCENHELCWGGEEEEDQTNSVLEETVDALKRFDGKVYDAADYLCVAPSTVYRRINRFGIDVEEYR